jgi:hypothetical protein
MCLEHRIRVNEIEGVVRKIGQVRTRGEARESVRCAGQISLGATNHFIRDIHPVYFFEVTRHGTHQTAGAAPDFQPTLCRWNALQLSLKRSHHVRACREKLLIVLLTTAERHVVMCIFGGSLIPLRAHLLYNVRVVHHLSS